MSKPKKRITGIDRSTPEAVEAAEIDVEELIPVDDDSPVDETTTAAEESDEDDEVDETDGKADGDETTWIKQLIERALRRNADAR